MPKTHPPYSPEFRRQMVDLVRAGRSAEDLAREFEPTAQSIGAWVAAADRQEGRREEVTPGLAAAERDELARLRRENKQLRLERDILSKAGGLVCTGDRRSAVGLFRFMSVNQACFPIATMARVLGVSKAGYHAWLRRPPSARAVADEALLKRVRTVHATSRQTYGAPRVHADLRAQGERHGRKRITRLMRQAGLVGASHRHGGPTTTRRDKDARPAPDLVDRNFAASGPNQLWVADITYVPTAAGFLYLAVVVDAWSRKVVGWSMANHLRAELVLDAMEMAVGQRRPKNVIHHSDQGSQYTSVAFGKRCGEAGVRPSMGSVGDAYDNAMAESFFSTLEAELLSRRRFTSQAEARMACFSYIEGWYNPVRLHSALGYRSPMTYEALMQEADVDT
ncbi:IS3 family transposase [Roseomonas sp. TAS13]|uniref:IS3 family transposase n=1 Tax=Roseomonas sp. TAS13 TaxID=1926319 RepID=UPI0011152C1F|nr:IS3 family transposase [Roseomonas sp. TAS13]USQ73995.1 IS3 family transposase [Roseomonas mucosa]USQ74356.1 IS3 family transposase [Roseomonas mucosa]